MQQSMSLKQSSLISDTVGTTNYRGSLSVTSDVSQLSEGYSLTMVSDSAFNVYSGYNTGHPGHEAKIDVETIDEDVKFDGDNKQIENDNNNNTMNNNNGTNINNYSSFASNNENTKNNNLNLTDDDNDQYRDASPVMNGELFSPKSNNGDNGDNGNNSDNRNNSNENDFGYRSDVSNKGSETGQSVYKKFSTFDSVESGYSQQDNKFATKSFKISPKQIPQKPQEPEKQEKREKQEKQVKSEKFSKKNDHTKTKNNIISNAKPKIITNITTNNDTNTYTTNTKQVSNQTQDQMWKSSHSGPPTIVCCLNVKLDVLFIGLEEIITIDIVVLFFILCLEIS